MVDPSSAQVGDVRAPVINHGQRITANIFAKVRNAFRVPAPAYAIA